MLVGWGHERKRARDRGRELRVEQRELRGGLPRGGGTCAKKYEKEEMLMV